MLLEFRTRNYKTFKEEMVFSMLPAPKQKGLDYSLLNRKIGRKKHKALCSAVIYGPNASGKTNLIGAMDTFKNIVLRGNIRNHDSNVSPNTAAYSLMLIPNLSLSVPSPVEFFISFIDGDIWVEYSFSMDIGRFLDFNYPRKIVEESLKINGNSIFLRTDELKFESLQSIDKYLVNGFEQNQGSAISLSERNLNCEELFLMNGFKNMFSSKIASHISNWLTDKFGIIYRADCVGISQIPFSSEKGAVYVDDVLNKALNRFGVDSNPLGFASRKNDEIPILHSLLGKTLAGDATIMSAEVFESYGTIRFATLFPLIVEIMENGGVLAVDEFDASIHPMALMSIINIFHNDELNINGAQLIFNTHNPIFLNANLFRRDEIKFVERDAESHTSVLYSLSDFGTAGEKGVRKNEDYMKNYFVSRYGAIQDIDFTPIFEKLIEEKNRV